MGASPPAHSHTRNMLQANFVPRIQNLGAKNGDSGGKTGIPGGKFEIESQNLDFSINDIRVFLSVGNGG